MTFQLNPLPYELDALEPAIGRDTVDVHYNAHHKGYVNKLNDALEDRKDKPESLEQLIVEEDGGVFNLAAQIWNHDFYWRSLKPQGGGQPSGPLADAIAADFGDVDSMLKELKSVAAGQFGSGWAWLVYNSEGKLELMSTSDADNPLRHNKAPLLTIDVWEHAYYLDYQNKRPDYLSAVIDQLLNWDFAAQQYERAAQALSDSKPATEAVKGFAA